MLRTTRLASMCPRIRGIFLLLWMVSLSTVLQAQCERSEYNIILPLIEQDLEARNYERAINRLLDVRDICPDEKRTINNMIKGAFAQIEREKTTADSALEVANRVLEQMYFYADKFGLTLKEVDYAGSGKYRYGFIDRLGNEVIPFLFEEASPFDRLDGFARVRIEGKKYLLDTAGTTYLLAENFDELTEETEALDIHNIIHEITSLPKNIGVYTNLNVFLAYYYSEEDWGFEPSNPGNISRIPESFTELINLRTINFLQNQLTILPESINNLTNLKELSLGGNQLKDLPESIRNLTKLEKLSLEDNYLTDFPASIENLTNLKELNLSGNLLTEFPENAGNLVNLKYLNLGAPSLGRNFSYELTALPESIGNLTNLKELYLYGNKLTHLPESIGRLTKLEKLDLSGNPLKTLPKFLCDIPSVWVDYSLESQLKTLCDN